MVFAARIFHAKRRVQVTPSGHFQHCLGNAGGLYFLVDGSKVLPLMGTADYGVLQYFGPLTLFPNTHFT